MNILLDRLLKLICILSLLACVLFPPWVAQVGSEAPRFIGLHFAISAPTGKLAMHTVYAFDPQTNGHTRPETVAYPGARISLTLLLLELVCVVLVFALLRLVGFWLIPARRSRLRQ